MTETPKSLRVHIGIFGRANAGKSSLLNLIAGQSLAIVSEIAGTTTDVVRKSMELLPIGPVTFLDTAGIDDSSLLGEQRTAKTREALDSADIALIVTENGQWGAYERELAAAAKSRSTPVIPVVAKIDVHAPDPAWLAELRSECAATCGPDLAAGSIAVSCTLAAADKALREQFLNTLTAALLTVCPESILAPPTLLGDLVDRNKTRQGPPMAVLVVPVDSGAPKGRLILPQVQSIRDSLDSGIACCVVRECEYEGFLSTLTRAPDLVVCDSQVARFTAERTPRESALTTFSILFSRAKGDIVSMAAGAARIASLREGERVLIAEACTHHAMEDDIGTVKIPRWLRQAVGGGVAIDHARGKDYPKNLADYSLVIHCGACTLTRREMLSRIQKAKEANVPVTNYGIAISALQGVAERMLAPFPEALSAWIAATGAASDTAAGITSDAAAVREKA
ncbi:MAG TPA: [FeFe] hydrogenase H-cluster maturation GTPase HydF [Treponemataceae bacterium]|nr:[FeFe] hydrogenase H-cluster maturation GTPase HydF [Treponemataceae bacterium]